MGRALQRTPPPCTPIPPLQAYLAVGRGEAFVQILTEALETLSEMENFFGKVPEFEVVQCHCALAAYFLEQVCGVGGGGGGSLGAREGGGGS